MIQIFSEEGGKHHKPHFHARYAEHRAVFDLGGNCIAGELPPKQRKLIEAWVVINTDELSAAWQAWQEFGEVIKIKGLS